MTFIYTGPEPEGPFGNDTAENAGIAGPVGPFLVPPANSVTVFLESVFTGSVSSNDGQGGAGTDPVDFVTMTTSTDLQQVDIGFQMSFMNATGALLTGGVSGGIDSLTVGVSGAANLSHTIEMRYGFFAVVEEFSAASDAILAALTANSDALLVAYTGPPWDDVLDSTAITAVNAALGQITQWNSDIVGGNFGDAPQQFQTDTLAALNTMVQDLGSLATSHPAMTAFRDQTVAAAEAMIAVVQGLLDIDVYLDGTQVDPAAIPGLDLGLFDLEWTGSFATSGEQLLIEISGSSFFVSGETADTTALPLQYGFGVEAVSYVIPVPQTVLDDGPNLFDGGPTADFIDGLAGDDTLSGLSGADTLIGGDGFDSLLGGIGNDSLNGGLNEDTLRGGAGDDELVGERGHDLIVGSAGFDLIDGGRGGDDLRGGGNGDTILGAGGADTIRGDQGSDSIVGGTGDDSILGGGLRDTLDGGTGNDFLNGNTGSDVILGGDGRDTLEGGGGRDLMDGGAGRDRINGGGGNDQLSGEAGNDTLFGSGGFDTLHGGAGNDLLTGGANADVFIFEDGHGNDRIRDFNAINNAEYIDLSGVSALNSFADVLAAATQVGSNVIIDTGGGNSIELVNVDLGRLGDGDFAF